MARESKTFIVVYGVYDINDIIRHREIFGWQLISAEGVRANMSRDTTIPNYARLKEIEQKYDNALLSYREYKEKAFINEPLLGLLLLFFIIPGLLYIMYKNKMSSFSQNQLTIAIEALAEAELLN